MIGAIVLAAGRSSRMGAPKVFLPFGGKSVIAHIVDVLLAAPLDRVYVVTGHHGARIAEHLSARPVTIVPNPHYDLGMLSSVRCGLQALPRECEAVLVALGDQPNITAQLIDDMLRAYRATDRGIVVPVHGARRGHPLLFAAPYRTEILNRYDDVGLRGLLRAHSDDVFELHVASASVLADMDLPEDYRRERARYEKRMNENRPPRDA